VPLRFARIYRLAAALSLVVQGLDRWWKGRRWSRTSGIPADTYDQLEMVTARTSERVGGRLDTLAKVGKSIGDLIFKHIE
jgi:hypothetical protein